MLRGGSPVVVVQLREGQSIVQVVIQSAQSSVIMQTAQVQGTDSDDSQDFSDSGAVTQKNRELLARRPSYRKVLNDRSSEEVTHGKGEENNSVSPGVTGVTTSTTQICQASSEEYFLVIIAANGTIQLAPPASEEIQGIKAVTMADSGEGKQGSTILRDAQTPDGQQILVPGNQVVVQDAGGEMQTYQIQTASASASLSETTVRTSSVELSQTKWDDLSIKREIRRAKNRESARKSRKKKKEYVECLENRIANLEKQNKTINEELKILKDLYCVKTL